MNYAPSLSTVCCESCAAECHHEQLHAEHAGLCVTCGDDLQAQLDAERAEELLSDDEIVEALLEVHESGLDDERQQDERNADRTNEYEPRRAFL